MNLCRVDPIAVEEIQKIIFQQKIKILGFNYGPNVETLAITTEHT